MSFVDDELFDDSFYDNLELLNSTSPEVLFRILGVKKWIDENVVYVNNSVDIEATSLHMGIPVHYSMPENAIELGQTTGILDRNEPVEISLSDKPHHVREIKVIFGHELGHIFIDRVLDACRWENPKEEAFCNYIGLMIALPDEEIEALSTVNELSIMMLSEHHSVSHGNVIERLMRVGKLPGRVSYDVVCGDRRIINPYYRDKASRHVICLECIDNLPHANANDIMTVPNFDFTSHEVFTTYEDSISHGETTFNEAFHRALNLQHGRWNDRDEAQYQSNIKPL